MTSSRGGPRSHAEYLGRTYLPELDGLRAISVLLVISCHMRDRWLWEWLGGWQGVSIFFVLSGYLITMLGLREESRHGRVSLKAFYIRRVCRILPLYWIALGTHAALIWGAGWARPLRQNFTDAFLSYVFYYPEIALAFQSIAQGKGSPFSHAWTLGIEEKYYLLWPALAFLLLAQRSRGRVLAAAMLLTVLLPLAGWSAWASPALAAWKLDIWVFPYGQILLGCLVALLLESARGWRVLDFLGTRAATVATLLALVALQLASWPLAEQSPGQWPTQQVWYSIAVAAFLTSLLVGEGLVQRVLRVRWLVAVGKLSYGMYLFQGIAIYVAQKVIPPRSEELPIALATFVVASLLSIALAWVLAVIVERPLIRRGRDWARRVATASRVGA